MEYITRLEKRLALRGEDRNVQRAKEDQGIIELLKGALKEKDDKIRELEIERKQYLEIKTSMAIIIENLNREIASLHGDKDVWFHDITEGVEKTLKKVDSMEMGFDMGVVGINNVGEEIKEQINGMVANVKVNIQEAMEDFTKINIQTIKDINTLSVKMDEMKREMMTHINTFKNMTPRTPTPPKPSKRARLVVETIPNLPDLTPGTYYNGAGRIDVIE